MIISITSGAHLNGRPTQIGENNVTIQYGSNHTFSVEDFTSNTTPPYLDPEGDDIAYIKILSVPTHGIMKLSGVHVWEGQKVLKGDLVLGNFVYESEPNKTYEYEGVFSFDIADVGSQTLSGLDTGLFKVKVETEPFQAPDTVGDNSFVIEHGESYVFEESDFLSGTTPPYSHPQGKKASHLKITSLPEKGSLKFNGETVTLNAELPVRLFNEGFFKYVSDSTETDLHEVDFDFELKDEDSNQYVG